MGRRAYTALLYLLLPAVLLRLAWLGLRNRAYWRRLPERFGWSPVAPGPAGVWIHAVSVGEVQAAVPLVRALRARDPARAILVTTTTPSGSDAVRARLGESVVHCYCPYDYPGALARLLDRVRPALVVLMEVELWPNLVAACRARAIAVALVNARMSERGARRYGRLRRLSGEVLGALDWIAAQGADDAGRLVGLGAPAERVEVTGSLKFDVQLAGGARAAAQALRQRLGAARPVWVAASTHEGEEEQVLAAHGRVLAEQPGALLVLAPRHPGRCPRVAELCRRAGMSVVWHSRPEGAPEAAQVYLVDTLGELASFYGACDVAFVGGSLVSVGGHNVLEPAVLGVPVLTGPHVVHFALIVERLREAGGLRQVPDEGELARAVCGFIADPALRESEGARARRFVESNRGAAERVAQGLLELLARPSPQLSAAARRPS